MKVFSLKSYEAKKNVGLIIGAFESFHTGHRKILEKCESDGLSPVILMFKDPESLPKNKLPLFQTLSARLIHLAELGIQEVILLDTKDTLALQPNEFIDVLKENVNPDKIYIGRDFNFGKNRQADSETMKHLFPSTDVVKEYRRFDKKVSTTFMKEMIELGDFDLLNKVYGASYLNTYTVENNILLEGNHMIPHSGVYVCEFEIKSIKYWGLINVSFHKVMTIHIPDLETEENYKIDDVLIHWKSNVRLTISEKNNSITEDDYKSGIKILNNEIMY